jgi:hypothetical protein
MGGKHGCSAENVESFATLSYQYLSVPALLKRV